MTDLDLDALEAAKAMREQLGEDYPKRGSILDLWFRTADALESTTARLREAEAVIKDIAALHIKRERPSLIDCSHGPELTACRTRMIVATYKPTTEND